MQAFGSPFLHGNRPLDPLHDVLEFVACRAIQAAGRPAELSSFGEGGEWRPMCREQLFAEVVRHVPQRVRACACKCVWPRLHTLGGAPKRQSAALEALLSNAGTPSCRASHVGGSLAAGVHGTALTADKGNDGCAPHQPSVLPPHRPAWSGVGRRTGPRSPPLRGRMGLFVRVS